MSTEHKQASFELRSSNPKQRSEVEIKGYKRSISASPQGVMGEGGMSTEHKQASFELRSSNPKQRSEVEIKGYKAKENSNYSPQPGLGSFVQDQ